MNESSVSNLQFVECDTCREKLGLPNLCAGCLNNRSTIARLNTLLLEQEINFSNPQEEPRASEKQLMKLIAEAHVACDEWDQEMEDVEPRRYALPDRIRMCAEKARSQIRKQSP